MAYDDLLAGFLGALYLGIVSLFEIKYGLFVFENLSIDNLVKIVSARLGRIRSPKNIK